MSINGSASEDNSEMKVYNVTASPLTGGKAIQITRNEIDSMKRKAKARGYEGYSMMLNVLSPPHAMARACMVPGTHALRRLLNGYILVGRLIIPAIIVLLFCRLWIWAAVAAVVGYIVVFRIQAIINYEIGARLFALDQHLNLENLAEQAPEADAT